MLEDLFGDDQVELLLQRARAQIELRIRQGRVLPEAGIPPLVPGDFQRGKVLQSRELTSSSVSASMTIRHRLGGGSARDGGGVLPLPARRNPAPERERRAAACSRRRGFWRATFAPAHGEVVGKRETLRRQRRDCARHSRRCRSLGSDHAPRRNRGADSAAADSRRWLRRPDCVRDSRRCRRAGSGRGLRLRHGAGSAAAGRSARPRHPGAGLYKTIDRTDRRAPRSELSPRPEATRASS